jgi:hypothetical protein
MLLARQSERPGRVSTHCQFARVVQLAAVATSGEISAKAGIDGVGVAGGLPDPLTAVEAMMRIPARTPADKMLL